MKRLIDRMGWALAGALAFALILGAARAIQAGPLDPPGPVASTMKTLADLAPSWHRILAANDGPDSCHSSRFSCVMSDVAVLDNETGLVWQRTPANVLSDWPTAVTSCSTAFTGSRWGWRLPSPDELGTLFASGLPVGHPFTAASAPYWTSAPRADDATFIVTINLSTGVVAPQSRRATLTTRAWCVRGGASPDIDAQSPYPKVWSPTLLDADDTNSDTNSSRFRDYGNPAYPVDQETGLMWQATPDLATGAWANAVEACARYSGTSDRLGWRLPTVAELLSLYTSAALGTLPTGHPFNGISGVYWTSSSTSVATAANAYTVDTAGAEGSTSLVKTATTAKHWCVRGGAGD